MGIYILTMLMFAPAFYILVPLLSSKPNILQLYKWSALLCSVLFRVEAGFDAMLFCSDRSNSYFRSQSPESRMLSRLKLPIIPFLTMIY